MIMIRMPAGFSLVGNPESPRCPLAGPCTLCAALQSVCVDVRLYSRRSEDIYKGDCPEGKEPLFPLDVINASHYMLFWTAVVQVGDGAGLGGRKGHAAYDVLHAHGLLILFPGAC